MPPPPIVKKSGSHVQGSKFRMLIGFLVAMWAAVEPASARVGVGVYGTNGHQLKPAFLAQHPHARMVAAAGVPDGFIPAGSGIRRYETLEEMLSDPEVELVSLCSPRRDEQANDAVLSLAAGKHVYAEKPAAMTETELDLILATAAEAGRQFHEMAGTAMVPPHIDMRREIQAGAIGTVVQVIVEKSYPYGDGARRPQDEGVDGGLFLQIGIHAIRLIEHVADVRIEEITALQTDLGNPEDGALHMAATMQMRFENGGIAVAMANYLNPVGRSPRAFEYVKIFGTDGIVESLAAGSEARIITQSGERAIQKSPGTKNYSPLYFDYLSDHLATGQSMPFSLEEELHPLRMLLRARSTAE